MQNVMKPETRLDLVQKPSEFCNHDCDFFSIEIGDESRTLRIYNVRKKNHTHLFFKPGYFLYIFHYTTYFSK